jgi:hypothetical protein
MIQADLLKLRQTYLLVASRLAQSVVDVAQLDKGPKQTT